MCVCARVRVFCLGLLSIRWNTGQVDEAPAGMTYQAKSLRSRCREPEHTNARAPLLLLLLGLSGPARLALSARAGRLG